MPEQKRRVFAIFFLALLVVVSSVYSGINKPKNELNSKSSVAETTAFSGDNTTTVLAIEALGKLAIKGRAPKTDYTRDRFGNGWDEIGNCDIRNHILARDMSEVKYISDKDCTVVSGKLIDPYTGKIIDFVRGAGTSTKVQIDHVVALSDAWQKGAQQLSKEKRQEFANDSLNLLAVDGPANQQKSDSDAASWLPPNKEYRCRYVARQIAIKIKYILWITQGEHDAIKNVLKSCPGQQLPIVHNS